jgi:hypothetical protein
MRQLLPCKVDAMSIDNILTEGLFAAANTLSGSKAGAVPRPTTDDELHAAVKKYFNVDIPRRQICEHHKAPFTAFANAFFARDPVAVWKASRGFGGKSMLLALLGLCESVFIGAKCNILGGSGEQSERVLNYINGEEAPEAFWNAPDAPRHLIVGGAESEVAENARGITKRMIKLTNGGYLKALMASSKSVRGPHPQRLRLDEVDEMEISIFDSALGQPMKRFGIDPQIVASSTHQYSNGTMTEILKRAAKQGWGVYEWCYRENLQSNGGWLADDAVAEKRGVVTAYMWETEYENQEPNPEGRAIDVGKCRLAFKKSLGEWEGKEHEECIVEEPYKGGLPELECHRCDHPYRIGDIRSVICAHCGDRRRLTRPASYAHGCDWAKKRDWTIITTIRTDIFPARVVAWKRTGRLDWPAMIGMFENRIRKYGGSAAHDITGLGGVIEDYLTVASEGVLMQGLPRHELLSHWITAIEHGMVEIPMIKYMFDEHRLASVEDVYKSGDKYHLPDTMSSGALAWKAGGLGAVGEIMIPMLDSTGKVVIETSHAFKHRPTKEQLRK